jgi:DNA repair protein RecO (recombination protein O)
MAEARIRVADQPGYVLHAYPYSETSLLIELFTRDHGRVPLVAKGAKRPGSVLRGALQSFQPLQVAWSGRGEVRTLARAEWQGGVPLLVGRALLCGFYLNELVLKLLARDDPHPGLFAAYERAVAGLAADEAEGPLLRRFEVRLLAELGYALELEREADSGLPLDVALRYHYVFDKGPCRDASGRWPVVSGETLVALREGTLEDGPLASEARLLMRELLDHHLERQPLFSRNVLRELSRFGEGEG